MRIAWVLGWAVPAEWFAAEAARAWPEAEHVCVPAAPDWRGRLEACDGCDAVGGYSLGALLLLDAGDWAAGRWATVGLIAPIWAFPAEAGRGGRVARTQLRALARWVRRDEAAAREDFYERSEIGSVRGAAEPAETLLWGLEELETCSVAPGLPSGWRGYAGAVDTLINTADQAREAPGLRVVAGAGHAPGALIAAWAKEWRGK